VPGFNRVIKPVYAMSCDQRLKGHTIGIESGNASAISPFRLSPELIRL
jgi:hypothetical protein